MIKVVPFRRWHLAWLREAGAAEGGFVHDVSTLMVLEQQNSWTVAIDGDPVACGGTIEQWPGRHVAWTYMNRATGPHMTAITKAVRQKLKDVQGRVELTVRTDFEQGHRWARILGFEVETPEMPGYGPEGESHTGYVRFNKG